METVYQTLDWLLGLSATTPAGLSVAQVCLRTVAVFIIMIGYVRFGKKRFLGQATAFDAILVIVIGSIASRAISGTAPFGASLVATFVLILVHRIISYLTESSPFLSYMTKGHDTLIIHNGKVDRNALHDAHMSDDDLAEDLRHHGIAKPSEVLEARLERNGKLSVIKK
jgi:uncharacterized membrane protein YcaP (DUF421 family)